MKTTFYILICSLCVGLLMGCASDGGDSRSPDQEIVSEFSKVRMLQHWADHFITPAYEDFNTKSKNLEDRINAFTQNPTNDKLNSVREALHLSMMSYQYMAFYRFGKAEEVDINFQFRVNTYPTNTNKIIQNAQQSNYNFTSQAEIMYGQISQGLPAIDYMVNNFGASNDTDILAKFSTDVHAISYKNYLKALATEILRTSNIVLTHWKSTGKDALLSNTSNNATTALNQISNAYIQYYEKNLRAGKFGYPAGILTPMFLPTNTTIKPELIESRFSPQNARTYALEGIIAMQKFFQGEGIDGVNGPSYKQYLEHLGQSNTNYKSLTVKIITNFNDALVNTQKLNPNFIEQLHQEPQKMKDVYFVLQKNVPLLKVDMAQAMNITISYMDTDGD